MDDYHIRKLTDGTWIVSCYEGGGKDSPGKQVEYAYDSLDEAVEDLKNGFSDEPEEEEAEPEEKPRPLKKIMEADDE